MQYNFIEKIWFVGKLKNIVNLVLVKCMELDSYIDYSYLLDSINILSY